MSACHWVSRSCLWPVVKQRSPSPLSEEGPARTEALVSVTGKVVPKHWAALGFSGPGIIGEVLVSVGQQVEAGQLLARLDAPELDASVEQAEAALQTTKAQLARLEADARDVDLRGARVAVDTAREGVKAAEAAVVIAQANVSVAEATVASAQAASRRTKAGPTAEELEVARQNIELSKSQLYAAQGQRDAIGGLRSRAAKDPVARAAYQEGSHEAAQGQVLAAERNVEIAELNYRILEAGPRSEDRAASEAQVSQTKAALVAAQAQEAAAQQQIAISQKQIDQAQAQLDALQAPARQEDLAVAQAQVSQAEAALAATQAALSRTRLRAPFSGSIGELNLREAEYVVPGAPMVILGDLASLQVEVTDLDEIDVTRVAEGSKARLTFDALPGVTLAGTIESISPKATAGGGGTVFRVIITLDSSDPRLRWGMTAFADIETE